MLEFYWPKTCCAVPRFLVAAPKLKESVCLHTRNPAKAHQDASGQQMGSPEVVCFYTSLSNLPSFMFDHHLETGSSHIYTSSPVSTPFLVTKIQNHRHYHRLNTLSECSDFILYLKHDVHQISLSWVSVKPVTQTGNMGITFLYSFFSLHIQTNG